jgi:hypothetical protein
MDYRLLGEDVEVFYRVIKYDACHSDTSQGIGHINSRVLALASVPAGRAGEKCLSS